MTDKTRKKTHSTMTTIRRAAVLVVFAACVLGIVAFGGAGSLCSFGTDAIAYLCPLGALETTLGTGAIVPRALIVFAIVAIAAILFGKAFCSWMCPIPPLDRFLSTKKQRKREAENRHLAATEALHRWHACADCASARTSSCQEACSPSSPAGQSPDASPTTSARALALRMPSDAESVGQHKSLASAFAHSTVLPDGATDAGARNRAATLKRRPTLDSRHLVLAGSLVSAAVCGFPVFCLVCPIGLTIATIVALYRLVGFNELTLDLALFPALIVFELVVLRKWCHRFCPVGALLSLFASLGRTTRPRVDQDACLRSAGTDCAACASACPERIDPVADLGRRSISECTRCGRCAQACPADAISFVGTKPRLKRNEKTRVRDAKERPRSTADSAKR